MTADPLAVPTSTPRFGWQMRGADGTLQSAYQVEVFTRDGKRRSMVWDSGKVTSSASQLVAYAGPSLSPLTRLSLIHI